MHITIYKHSKITNYKISKSSKRKIATHEKDKTTNKNTITTKQHINLPKTHKILQLMKKIK